MLASSRGALHFVRPRGVVVVEEPIAEPGRNELLVQTIVSAISPGTELLVYRGEVPPGMALDASIASLGAAARFPCKYGYSTVGRVVALGADVGEEWLDRLVFSLHPHETRFLARVEELHQVPPGVSAEDAALYPSVETALTLVMDGRPMIGEHVAVFGQGVVGLLVTALLARHPLASLLAVDLHPLRRRLSRELGAHEVIDPADAHARGGSDRGYDLTYELSGDPATLDDAIAATGFGGRVVIGSWYGERSAPLALGGAFHRSRMRLLSSQVSTIDPSLTGRWSMDRRREVAWGLVAELGLARLVTHRFAFGAAGEAYELLDRHPEQAVQVLLDYDA
jgi:2-desacetyl-2-hydroxyethyl bacteriochlorophyllide A dehydrogenase